ncbi:MAG TPA: phosphatidylglycerol lysyltransferase domain-containing protein, partial [Spirochaetota bacterium]|nr:phosphatidylglycerol lysyltransferase domain-containing protein [Spirochaetota bacterium]
MRKTIFKIILPVSGAVILSIALIFLYRELESYHLNEIIQKLRDFPAAKLMAAILATVISYFIVTFYDLLAFRYIKQKLSYPRIFFTSLVSYIFGNNIGMSVLSSGTVRFRFYSAAGLSSINIIKIITFTAATFWIGIVTLAGIVFIIEPVNSPAILHIPFISLRAVGMIFLCIVAMYFAVTVFYKKTFNFKEWEIEIPDWKTGLGQIAVSVTDWSIAGLVLYFLLPESVQLSYTAFIPLFLLAQISGLISHVPGGIGVFETVIMLLLAGQGGAPEIFSSLILYRFVYYLCPFAIGLLLFSAAEVSVASGVMKKAASFIVKWVPMVFPGVLAILIFTSGAVLLLSAALPNINERMAWLNYIFPLHVIEVSHFFTALTGAGLLFLSSRIQKRLYSAYYMTIILLVSGIVFIMLSGLNYEEGIVLATTLAVFYPCRTFFYRKASLFDQSFSPVWGAAIVTVITMTTWFGFFAYKHVPYSHDLWSSFGLLNDTSRFMRGTAGIFGVFSILSLILLIRPVPARPSLPTETEMELVKSIINRSGNPDGNLALLGDKYIFFNTDKTAFLMYGIQGKSWIVLGDPIGCGDEIQEIIWDFREESHKEDANLVFFEVSQKYLPVYIETGMNILKIGEIA